MIKMDDDLLFFLSHDVGRTRGRGGGNGCEERWQPRRRGGSRQLERRKRERFGSWL